ncbi:hypothetical protein AYO21_04541 [Fonsecaea monophora]|uniref:N-acetyltransferase domain-containing protein n=1 Tax=Fonsecaea monophora TaxID=254056 RepID=A0A177FBX0_9EURO|nr:hypothetical protein AYO21_04541 [Fonsecaea monophora]KAH0837081.1 hypothetical protein FOPE_04795 [Fonsecaea pedrosoi]OAG41161.1 hypothetical protein AYO21_04541 [Fonsecaea monophora]
MHLTDPIHLSLEDADNVVPDIARIKHSSLTATPLGQLRYGDVPAEEAREWLEACTRVELLSELKYPRIVGLECDGLGRHVPRMEHLVIRDLDLDLDLPQPTAQGDVVSDAGGVVVAFAEFQYHPLPGQEQEHRIKPSVSKSTTETQSRVEIPSLTSSSSQPPTNVDTEVVKLPSSAHRALHKHWDQTVEAALSATFGGMHCFEVRGIGTLSPTHLRKGIASRLLAWIFPWADRLDVPVVLAATPAGYPFYIRHGFVEVGDHHRGEGDDEASTKGTRGTRPFIECDMAEWGGIGIHRHVLMIRWPKHAAGVDGT